MRGHGGHEFIALARPIDRTLAAAAGALVSISTCLAVVLLLTISAMMLAKLGIDYEVAGGSPLSKIHPATYMAVFAAMLFMLARLDPFVLLDEVLRRHWGTLVFSGTIVLLLVQAVVVQRMPAAGIIDTFLLPVVLFVLVTRLKEGTLGWIGMLIHVVMAANAVLALIELATGFRLTPLVAAGVLLSGDWRSSALLGHPLANAIFTGAYILLLVTAGGRDLPRGMMRFVLLLQIGAMFAFGGRAASVLLILFAVPAMILGGARRGGPKRIGLVDAALAILVAAGAVVAGLLLAGIGFFDRFFDRFVDDQGSAETRIAMFSLIAQIPWQDLLFGPDPEHVATLQRLEGIEFGIESFWVAMIAQYGILASLPVFGGLLLFLFRDVWLEARGVAGWTILYLMAVASTSASFSGKTTSLAILVVFILVLARRTPSQRGAG